MARLSRKESRDLTRRALRVAARKELARRGVGGASVDRLVEAAGFSRGAFYANYANKDELLLELLLEHQNRALDSWRRLILGDGDLEQTLTGMAETLDAYHRNRDRALFAIELRLHAERDADFAKAYGPYLRELHVILREIVAELFRKAAKRPPADIDTLTAAIQALPGGLFFMDSSAKWTGSAQTLGQMYVLFLRGLIELGQPAEAPVLSLVDDPATRA
jgi:AcrR family transcriptional regulator